MSTNIGRPKSKNPLTIEVKARIDLDTDKRLQQFCEQTGMTRTEVVRKGIETVLGEKK